MHTGILPIDNNLAERSIRPVALGRKNYLFLGSGEDGGGDWAAIAYSILGSCVLNRLDPYRYLLGITPTLLRPGDVDHATLAPRMRAKADQHDRRLTVASPGQVRPDLILASGQSRTLTMVARMATIYDKTENHLS